MLIGLQGAGKSTTETAVLVPVIVSKDLTRDNRRPERRQRHLISAALASRLSVVVDDTNPSVEERAGIISAARASAARVVGYFFESPLPECAARDRRRRCRTWAAASAAKRLVRPSRTEGFDELWTVRTLPELRFDVRPYEESNER